MTEQPDTQHPMTAPADRLREAAGVVRKASAAATPGPWTYRRWHSDDCKIGCDDPSCFLLIVGSPHAMVGDADVDREPEVFAVERSVQERGEDDAAWIALMNPAVGEALAAWLESVANELDKSVPPGSQVTVEPKAFAVADAILAAVSR